MLLCFFLFACAKNTSIDGYPWPLGSENLIEIEKDLLVSLILVQDSLSPSSAEFLLTNKEDMAVEYGLPFLIQVEVSGKWYNIDFEYTVEDDGMGGMLKPNSLLILNAREEKKFFLEWKSIYGELPPGTYRLIEKLYLCSNDEYFYVSCLFTIE